MKSNRICDLACAMVGVGGLLIYVLACAPTFSPDGSKVLFTAFSESHSMVSIMLYDLQSHRLQTILSHSDGIDKDMSGMMLARWSSDGKRIIAIWQSGKQLTVLTIPIEGGGGARLYKLPEQGNESDVPIMACMVFPPPVVGEYLFLPGRQMCRLNLQTGQTVSGTSTNGFWLKSRGTNLFYMTKANSGERTFEIGRLASDSLKITPMETLPTISANDGVYWDVAADGAQVAIALENPPAIQIHRGGTLLKTIPVNVRTNTVGLGPLAWAADAKTLFVTYEESGGASGVLEISTQSNFQRVMPLQSDKGKGAIVCQPVLSPDGKTLAVSSFSENENSALFLIHLKERSWLSRWWSRSGPSEQSFFVAGLEVTKISMPQPTKPVGSSARTTKGNPKPGAKKDPQ